MQGFDCITAVNKNIITDAAKLITEPAARIRAENQDTRESEIGWEIGESDFPGVLC